MNDLANWCLRATLAFAVAAAVAAALGHPDIATLALFVAATVWFAVPAFALVGALLSFMLPSVRERRATDAEEVRRDETLSSEQAANSTPPPYVS